MQAFIKFNRGILRMPLPWQLWLMLLVAANLVAPLVFIGHLEAQVVLGAIVASMILMTLLTSRFGFTRILGLGHIPWIPLLAFLVPRLGDIAADDAFGIWLRIVVVLNSTSLMIDAVDVIRYVNGERSETVPNV